jgi:hypothetical protein
MHLDALRAIIWVAIKAPGDKCVAVVLGSSALCGVPLSTLARTFERVELINIINLK